MVAFSRVRQRRGQSQNTELATNGIRAARRGGGISPPRAPRWALPHIIAGAFGSPGWGWQVKSLTCGALAGQQRPEAQQDAQSGHRSGDLLPGKRGAPGAPGSWGSPARGEGLPG